MNLKNKLSVQYETAIIEDGRIVKNNAPKNNLILDIGLENLSSISFSSASAVCVLGSGTKPTKRDSGAVTVSISNGVATASAGFFELDDVGRLLKLDSGQEVYISNFNSSVSVDVVNALDDAATEFTVWYVDENGHENEEVRTNNLGSEAGDVETVWEGANLVIKRTFIFPMETEAKTYREIGWAHTTSNSDLFGRDLIPNGGDSISIGQQYKVIVKLSVFHGGFTQTSVPNLGPANFNSSGTGILETLASYTATWPTGNKNVTLAMSDFTQSVAPATTGNGKKVSSYTIKAMTRDAYVPNSRKTKYRVKFNVSEANGDIYGYGLSSRGDGWLLVSHKFDNPQTKDSDHELEIVHEFTWGRTLTN